MLLPNWRKGNSLQKIKRRSFFFFTESHIVCRWIALFFIKKKCRFFFLGFTFDFNFQPLFILFPIPMGHFEIEYWILFSFKKKRRYIPTLRVIKFKCLFSHITKVDKRCILCHFLAVSLFEIYIIKQKKSFYQNKTWSF